MSMGLLIDEEKPVVWRGPMVQGALTQLIDEVDWGEFRLFGSRLASGNWRRLFGNFTKIEN